MFTAQQPLTSQGHRLLQKFCEAQKNGQLGIRGTVDALKANVNLMKLHIHSLCRSQWPRGLRRRSAAARLLRSWVRIPQGSWMFVCCECCVLPGRGLCDELITRPEESYRVRCVVVCDLETSWMRRPWPTGRGVAVVPQITHLLTYLLN